MGPSQPYRVRVARCSAAAPGTRHKKQVLCVAAESFGLLQLRLHDAITRHRGLVQNRVRRRIYCAVRTRQVVQLFEFRTHFERADLQWTSAQLSHATSATQLAEDRKQLHVAETEHRSEYPAEHDHVQELA